MTLAPGVRSCRRLSARSNVVLPEPDGPMRLVTRFFATSKVQSRTAVRPWKRNGDVLQLHRDCARGARSMTACSVGRLASRDMIPAPLVTHLLLSRGPDSGA